MTQDRWLKVATGALILFCAFMSSSSVISQTTSGPDRLDFTAAVGQVDYPTSNVFPKPNVQVFRNGLLQRMCASPCDYTQQYIQSGSRIRVRFNVAPETGDYVTLVYWR